MIALHQPAATVDWGEYLIWRDVFASALDVTHTIQWLDGEVWAGAMTLMSNGEAAILITLTTHPSGIISVDGQLAAGELEAIEELIPLAEEWGKHRGASFASIDSRPGWARRLPGYRIDQVRIVKDLRDGAV